MKKFYSRENGFVECDNWEPRCWINIECPDSQDILYLSEEMGVPTVFLESACDEDERPRFDHEDGWLLTIIRIPDYNPDSSDLYSTLTFAVISKEDLVITICNHRSGMLESFIEHTQHRHIVDINKADFLLHFIYITTFWFLKYLKEINNRVIEYVKDLKRSVKNEDLYNLMQLQKSLVYFNTALKGNTTLVNRINNIYNEECEPALLEDVQIELQQALNTVDIYTNILESTMATLESVISNNVNDIMKKMTSVSIILMLPTLIASFYGMNVAVAFGNAHYAFWGIIGFSLAIAIIIFIWLKHIKWL